MNRIAITLAHSDAYEQSPDENWGVSLATNWTFGERWVPFLLAGVGNGAGENVVSKSTATLGLGYTFRTHDVLGTSMNFTNPAGGLRNQYTIESFYRFISARSWHSRPTSSWCSVRRSIRIATPSCILVSGPERISDDVTAFVIIHALYKSPPQRLCRIGCRNDGCYH